MPQRSKDQRTEKATSLATKIFPNLQPKPSAPNRWMGPKRAQWGEIDHRARGLVSPLGGQVKRGKCETATQRKEMRNGRCNPKQVRCSENSRTIETLCWAHPDTATTQTTTGTGPTRVVHTIHHGSSQKQHGAADHGGPNISGGKR